MLASVRSSSERKRYGIYYTPPEVAQTLAEWAILRASDTVLEPSFGGCNFLKAAHDRLLVLGCNEPLRQICGTDIDKHALDSVGQAFGMVDVQKRFLLKDFLSTTVEDFCVGEFDAIIGNPPYVSHHAIQPEQKRRAWTQAADSGWQLRRTASLWAYFVLHSLRFCKPGGRMAFVLPPALLLADYAFSVRTTMEASFDSVEYRDIRDRLFRDQGTEERSVVLLANGFRNEKHTRPSIAPRKRFAAPSGVPSLTSRTVTIFEAITSHSVTLGDCADLRIGTVTGANKLFVITAELAEEKGLNDELLLPALAKMPLNPGLEYTEDDHVHAVTAGDRCYLVSPAAQAFRRQPFSVRRYFSSFPSKARKMNRTFQKRARWFVIDDTLEPDAFLSYMHHEAPTLLLNTVRAVCTNNIHRVWWKKRISVDQQKLAAISFVTTFTQLSAELEGRTYGGGVLKHELGEARRIRLLMPASLASSSIASAYREIDRYLRRGERALAIARADRFMLSAVVPSSDLEQTVSQLATALCVVRDRRTAR